jgi:hypothetical protein
MIFWKFGCLSLRLPDSILPEIAISRNAVQNGDRPKYFVRGETAPKTWHDLPKNAKLILKIPDPDPSVVLQGNMGSRDFDRWGNCHAIAVREIAGQ